MAIKHSQRGMTMGSMLVLVIVIGFFGLLAIKIIPIYIDNHKIAGALKSLKETPDLVNQPASSVRGRLNKQFDMNYVDFLDPQAIQITSYPGYVSVSITYERVVPVIGNASALLSFDETMEVGHK